MLSATLYSYIRRVVMSSCYFQENDKECAKMVQISNILEYTIVQNGSKKFRMVHYGPEWSKMVQNGPKWSRKVQNSPYLC